MSFPHMVDVVTRLPSRQRKGNYRSAAKLEAAAARAEREQRRRNYCARKIQALLQEKGWSQAELARRASAHLTPPDKVGRDSISKYIMANPRSKPSDVHLTAIAKAFGVPPETIVPPNRATEDKGAFPALEISSINGGRVWLAVNQAVDMATATEIMTLLRKDKKGED